MKTASFRSNTSGNVSVMFAASIFAIIGVAGLAIDMIRAENMRANLNAAADAASLAAVAQIRESKLNSETKISSNAHLAGQSDKG
jgi:Flp pilus assembly protein TadG